MPWICRMRHRAHSLDMPETRATYANGLTTTCRMRPATTRHRDGGRLGATICTPPVGLRTVGGGTCLHPAAHASLTSVTIFISSASVGAARPLSCDANRHAKSRANAASTSGTTGRTEHLPNGQATEPVLMAVARIVLPCSMRHQQLRQYRWPHESAIGRSRISRQMGQV